MTAVPQAPERIPQSAIAYNRPSEVPYGERFDVELFIDISGGDAAASALATRKLENPHLLGDATVARAETGADVEVVLHASNASVDALIDGGRRLKADVPGRWRWTIRPAGQEPVELVLQVWQLDPTTRARLDPAVSAWEDTIPVRVTGAKRASLWVGDNWEWAWTFVVGPLGALGWGRMRRRSRTREEEKYASR